MDQETGVAMNSRFSFEETGIAGLFFITPFCSEDIRGAFTKDYSREVFGQNGIVHDLAEVFYTTSHKGVVRALHFQRVRQQPKLVRCIWGSVFDVVVDLRKGSPTFKTWLGFDLSKDNNVELLIPCGCAHGYLVLEESVVSYKCAEKFYGEYDDGIRWDDPEIGIDWPVDLVGGVDKVILSEKDRQLQGFAEFMRSYGGF
jgi:dTDP-4-dehydrorhamnose 3,5-epimerase